MYAGIVFWESDVLRRREMSSSTFDLVVDALSQLASVHVNSRFVEESSPMFSSRGARKVESEKKPAEDRSQRSSRNVPRYSIQSFEPLDTALKEVSRGGDTVRALGYLSRAREKTFVDQLSEYIDASSQSNAEIYKAAGIDRRLFSKIQADREYKPSKDTCVSLALALKLEEERAKDLLAKAGYALSRSSKRDLIIEFFFRVRQYDIDTINAVLDKLGEKTLGKIDYSK